MLSQHLPDLLHHWGQQSLGSFHAPGVGRRPKTDLRGPGIGGQGGIGHGGHAVAEELVDAALPDAEGHDVVGHRHFLRKAAQIGDGVVPQHGEHLIGRPRQHQDMDAALFKATARGGTHGVGKDGAALGQVGHAEVVLRHGGVEGAFVKGPDALGHLGVELQLPAEALAEDVLGDIVIGGPQAPGGDEDIGPLPCGGHGLTQVLRLIPRHGVEHRGDTDGGEGPGDLPGIGIGDGAGEQFIAHGDNLGGMGHGDASFKITVILRAHSARRI